MVESVVAFLGDQEALLVLDNCEHLLRGIRPIVAELLRGCPRLAILATSRVRLGIDGERMSGLSRRYRCRRQRGQTATNPAVRLFVERARAVRPDLRLDRQTLADIDDICRPLDGLPSPLSSPRRGCGPSIPPTSPTGCGATGSAVVRQ